MDDVKFSPCQDPKQYAALVDLWEASVRATHDFLTEEDLAEIKNQLATEYFPHVHLTVALVDGKPVGFSGTLGGNLEMLFIDPEMMGRGIGGKLLERTIEYEGVTRVDVNEQNPAAVGFYEKHGFAVVSRDELDEAGRPYPILHLELKKTS